MLNGNPVTHSFHGARSHLERIRLSRAAQPSRFEKTKMAFDVRHHRNKFTILRFKGFLPVSLYERRDGQTGAL